VLSGVVRLVAAICGQGVWARLPSGGFRRAPGKPVRPGHAGAG